MQGYTLILWTPLQACPEAPIYNLFYGNLASTGEHLAVVSMWLRIGLELKCAITNHYTWPYIYHKLSS